MVGAVLAGLLAAICAQAQAPLSPEAALARILQQSPAQAGWFADSFLAQIPTAKIDEIVAMYTGQLGAFQRIDASPDGYTVAMEHGTMPARIALDAEGKITGLWFGLPESTQVTSIDDTLKQFAALPGKVSVAVFEDGKLRSSLHPDDPLAVGSAFKLAILATLAQQIAAGKHRWDEVVPLQPGWKTLPSGVLLNWPDQTPLTLATLANEMISISDNTAADGLLAIAGREAVEKLAARNQPFLSTREAFVLKGKAQAALLAKYQAAHASGRRALLDEVDKAALPDAGEFTGAPVHTDIEWFFTTTELCGLMGQVADLPAMHINPGVAKKSDWTQIAFKGGSEPGVINLTTATTGRNGHRYCVAATWNDTASLDEKRFEIAYGSLLRLLAAGQLAPESAK
jgi:beta-lactamase class A